LFTTINFDRTERDKYFDQIPVSSENYNIHITDNHKVAGFKFSPKDEIFVDLDIINEIIYNTTSKH
jgi:hypothetical protein